MEYTLNIQGRLLQLNEPLVMGILNVTPDSFYSASRLNDPAQLVARASAMLDAGAAILDVGACSTRPGSEPVSQKEELERLHAALSVLDKEFPEAVVSVDTFRGMVARECAQEHNVAIINDVSGFDWDSEMLEAVITLRLPYILTHSVPLLPGSEALPEVLRQLSQKMWQLRSEGVADIIVDPGLGFGKTIEQNYELLQGLAELSLLEAPLLVGLSRKSMITKLLGIEPSEALSATTALNMVALSKGAAILRVHDVREAVQAVKMWKALNLKK